VLNDVIPEDLPADESPAGENPEADDQPDTAQQQGKQIRLEFD